jgi:hypothetical protein
MIKEIVRHFSFPLYTIKCCTDMLCYVVYVMYLIDVTYFHVCFYYFLVILTIFTKSLESRQGISSCKIATQLAYGNGGGSVQVHVLP